MPKYRVMILEHRDYVFEVDADSVSEAVDAAMDMDTVEAVDEAYRWRDSGWVELADEQAGE